MQLLYVVVNRIRVSPAWSMVEYWSKTFTRDGDVEITSWVTRIATNIGLLDGALINYISAEREELTLDHFLQAHPLREDKGEGTL